MEDLILTLVQSGIHWQRAEANLAELEEKIWNISGETHLILLPEMFNTGFTMNAGKFAEPMNGKSFKWLGQMSAQTGAVVCGSIIIREKQDYFNRLIWMQPDGTCFTYDKRHLFRMAGEDRYFTPGKQQLLVKLRGWQILPLICYDLRFPVWSRNVYDHRQNRPAYDLVLYVANWPAARIHAWDILLRARAIENLSYSAGLNRTGDDGNGISYNGHSAVYDPFGANILSLGEVPGVQTVTLQAGTLKDVREKFPVYLDSDSFTLNL